MRSLGMTAAIVADHGGCVAPLRLKRSAFDADRCLRLYKRPHLGLRPLPEAGFVRRPTGRCRAAERASARPISLPLRQGETREQITLQVSPAGHARYAACFQGLCCPQHHLTRSFLTSRPTPSPRTLTPAGTTPCRRGGDGDGAVWRARRGGVRAWCTSSRRRHPAHSAEARMNLFVPSRIYILITRGLDGRGL